MQPTTEILSPEDINYVCALVTEAGALAVALRNGIEISVKTGPYDKVTSADIALSSLIIERLTERFPNDCIISEEDFSHQNTSCEIRAWLVDPIDGTDNYISNDGQYSVMIGLLANNEPAFGWVYAPATDTSYYGGPTYGAWHKQSGKDPERYSNILKGFEHEKTRLIMGWRDRKAHPWVMEMPEVQIIKTGSIGLKVAKVLEDEADLFVHLSGKLKSWDTAGPIAIALGGGLEVGTLDGNDVAFPTEEFVHNTSVIIGRPGSLEWSRSHLIEPTS
jgi:3'(2'), 5'-bisphosphate nucleotidase